MFHLPHHFYLLFLVKEVVAYAIFTRQCLVVYLSEIPVVDASAHYHIVTRAVAVLPPPPPATSPLNPHPLPASPPPSPSLPALKTELTTCRCRCVHAHSATAVRASKTPVRVQCCFTSTETVRTISVLGTGSPARPPRRSHSS